MKKYDLPVDYNTLDWKKGEKRTVKEQYIEKQKGNCQYCEMPLNEQPSNEVTVSKIHWDLFPKGFKNHPVHLHHNHETGMTIGAVHMKCNAYLWQYKGE